MLIHESPLPIVEIPTTSITAHVLRTVDSMPDRVAIAAVDGSSSYTFSELDDAIHRFAGALAAGGFHPGDTLGIMAPNVPEYAVVFHGTAVAGGTVTTKLFRINRDLRFAKGQPPYKDYLHMLWYSPADGPAPMGWFFGVAPRKNCTRHDGPQKNWGDELQSGDRGAW